MTDNLPKSQRNDSGHFLPGNTVGLSGRPKRVAEIEELAQSRAPEAFAKVIELLGHKDGRVSLAAANTVLAYAYGKPTERVKMETTSIDIGRLWLAAVQDIGAAEKAKTIEGTAVKTHLVEGKSVPIKDDTEPNTW
jgi:hypothetical protein